MIQHRSEVIVDGGVCNLCVQNSLCITATALVETRHLLRELHRFENRTCTRDTVAAPVVSA